jgi:hypothetical protein
MTYINLYLIKTFKYPKITDFIQLIILDRFLVHFIIIFNVILNNIIHLSFPII